MSKHLGNILEPIPLMDEHGADAVRWFMAAGGSPWRPRRVGHTALQEIVRKTLLTYWNTVAFQSLYARAAGWAPADGATRRSPSGPLLDRWALSEVHRLARDVDAASRPSTPSAPAGCSRRFVDDLSNWYVRRSRRRFWRGDPAALATLHECLGRRDPADGAADAVHHRAGLAGPVRRPRRDRTRPSRCTWPSWPEVDEALIDDDAGGADARWSAGWSSWAGRPAPSPGSEDPAAAGARAGRRRRLGRAARRAAGRRSPRSSTSARSRRSATPAATWSTSRAKGNFRALGKRFGKRTPDRRRGRSRQPTRPRSPPRCARRGTATVDGRRRAESRSTAEEVMRHRDPARGLGGGRRRRARRWRST